MRRLLAAAGAAALSLAIVVPVARAVVPDGRNQSLDWWTPVKYDQQGRAQPQPATAPDGAVVYASDEIVTVKVHFVDGVKNWDVRVQPDAGGAPSTCHEDLAQENGKYPTDIYISCPWDTTRAVDRTLDQPTPGGAAGDQNLQRHWHLSDHGVSANGRYSVQVIGQSAGQPQCGVLTCSPATPPQSFELYQDSGAKRWRQVYVTNGVADPTGVTNSFDPATNRINVTWAPNPEPDVTYLVQEKVGGGQWSAGVAVPGSATNYVRTVDQPGKYQYQVAAVRPAPTADSGKGASATKTSGFAATQAVDIAQVTPPTTAGGNGPDGSVDGGDPGVLIPGDSPSSTAPGAHGTAPAKGTAAAGRSGGGASGARPSGTASRPTGSAAGGTGGAPGEAEGEGTDGGFSSTLPYTGTQGGTTDGLGSGSEEQPESMSKVVNLPRPQDARSLLIPVALGLLIFVFAMQLKVVTRRNPAMAAAQDDFDDFDEWMRY
ncbi:MAG: hypothetical protein QOI86_4421 [Actinomycetota bacterium]|jgi:hypothetical protein|nr:hypothetical protein [Actinomycetota bacterium]